MDFEGTPESPTDGERPVSTGGDLRIQSGVGSSSPNAYSDPSRSKSAEVIPIRPTAPADPPESEDAPIPVWMQRSNIVMKFLICVWLGMVISVLPWTPVWSDNSLMLSLPKLRAFATTDFVRGMITGIGLIDIWIGIWEAVHYRDQRPAPRTVAR
jgi:hypothetical protein